MTRSIPLFVPPAGSAAPGAAAPGVTSPPGRILRKRLAAAALSAAALLAGCGTGGMGQVAVSRECGAGRSCDRSALDVPIAIGARLTPALFAAVKGSAMPALTMRSAAAGVLAVERGQLVGVAPGASAILFATPEGTVIDFLHMWVARASRLELRVELADHTPLGSAATSIDLLVGDELHLTAAVFSDAQRLGGDFELALESSDASVAVLRGVTPERRRLIARSPGQSTITASALGLETTLTITVQP